MGDEERPYTTGEIAALSHVTINAVKKWIAAGKLKAFKTPGGHFRIKKEDFKEFVIRYRFHVKDELFPSKKKVLIADDEPSVVDYLKEALEHYEGEDFSIETAGDGYEALIKVGAFKPDLLVLDIRMPKLDGVEVCRRLRSEEKTRGMKILAITAYGQEDRLRILDAGADDCLHKPLHMDEFRKNVDKLLK